MKSSFLLLYKCLKMLPEKDYTIGLCMVATCDHPDEHSLESLGFLVHEGNNINDTEFNKINTYICHFLNLCTGFPQILLKTNIYEARREGRGRREGLEKRD